MSGVITPPRDSVNPTCPEESDDMVTPPFCLDSHHLEESLRTLLRDLEPTAPTVQACGINDQDYHSVHTLTPSLSTVSDVSPPDFTSVREAAEEVLPHMVSGDDIALHLNSQPMDEAPVAMHTPESERVILQDDLSMPDGSRLGLFESRPCLYLVQRSMMLYRVGRYRRQLLLRSMRMCTSAWADCLRLRDALPSSQFSIWIMREARNGLQQLFLRKYREGNLHITNPELMTVPFMQEVSSTWTLIRQQSGLELISDTKVLRGDEVTFRRWLQHNVQQCVKMFQD